MSTLAHDHDRRFHWCWLPLLIGVLQIFNLAQAILLGSLADNCYIAVCLPQYLAHRGAPYIIFLITNIIVLILLYLTYYYIHTRNKRLFAYYDWEFYWKSRRLYIIMFVVATLIIPILFYIFLLLGSIWTMVENVELNKAFVLLFFIPNLIQQALLTHIYQRCYKYGGDSARVTNSRSVSLKQILSIIAGVFGLLFLVFGFVWDFDTEEGVRTVNVGPRVPFILFSIWVWIIWLAVFLWHATMYYEVRALEEEEDVEQ
ncbi:hypothetical protein RCL1_008951 [Eukaryota sp. TZLM3-RCL]